MYCFNNVVIIDHDGLFIYVDAGFAGSFHDVRCLRASDIYDNCREYFKCDNLDDVQEYLLGDPGYMGAEMFILRRVDGREVIEEGSAVADAFNKRHASRRVKVEWGIGGLKNRFRKFLTVCSNRRYKFRAIFESCCRLTNFAHRHRLEFRTEDLGSQAGTAEDEEIFASEWA
jgi:DDE superfamily endonuclease